MKKIIRDKIPDLMNDQDRSKVYKIQDITELYELMKAKVVEEALEIQQTTTREELIEEIVDLTHVLEALKQLHGIAEHDILRVGIDKILKRGGFREGYVLEWHDDSHSNESS